VEHVARRERETHAARGTFDAVRLLPQQDADPLLLEPRREELARVRVEPRQKVPVVLHDRDLGPHSAEELRELHADGSAPEHEQAGRDAARPDRISVRPELDVGQAVDRRNPRMGSGRHHELVEPELALPDGHHAGARDVRVSADQLRVLAREPACMPRVVAPVRDLVAPPEHSLHVDLTGDRLRRSGCGACRCEHFRRPEQGLRG
jgi:hypothetical protein